MPEHPDYSALLAGQLTVLEAVNSGEVGLPILDRLLQVAARTLGAPGVAFVEYAPSGGRVVAAIGSVEWAVGRPLPAADRMAEQLLTGPRVRALGVDVLPPELAQELDDSGLGQLLAARVEIGGLTIGSLHALYPDRERPGSAAHQAVLGYLAACVAHLYRDQAGLPVHGDGSVVAALADGLAIVSRDGTVQLWNPAAEKVTGLRVADLLDRRLPFPVPPPGQVVDHRLPDGRWLKITSGELPGGAARVVTFSDSGEQHLRDHDRDLFVAVTSHELRTPVTVVKGYADTLTAHWDSLSESDRRQAAGAIGQRAGELARLVDRLLSSTNDAGTVGGAPPVPFDLAEALRAAAADLPADLRHRLTIRLPEHLPKALGNRASLATVLTELVTNAGKYSPDGSAVQLTAESDRRTVAFRVSDRGIGVRPDHVERAFERFWQAESGDRRRYPGAGLGLYLVRRIIERQNGWVSLRPRDGGGTVAEVRLPRG
ncbi:sensor histidine kinase [Plantactinospora sonchi]|uniref:Sensor-like histidine kinase SenX3 n=1 Tax=Plantactinospora sonchi TaxID=1544735 RepID=A0ABU7RPC5_9ACTN